MICKFCGSQVEKGSFCPNCGGKIMLEEPTEQAPVRQPTPLGLRPDANGAYHWEYTICTFSNPTVLIHLLWFLFGFGVFVAAVQLMLWAGDGCTGDILATVLFVVKITAGLMAFSAALWSVLMLIKGPHAVAKYTMDDKKISYVTDPLRDVKRGKLHFHPAHDGDPGPNKWDRLVSEYYKVKKIKVIRKRNLIRVYVFMQMCTVYVPEEHFDFVREYITSRCPSAKIKGMKSDE